MGASVRPDPLDAVIASRRKALDTQGTAGGTDDLDALIAERRKAAGGKPGVFSRAMTNLGEGLTHAIAHPIDTAEQMIVAPIKSAFTATVAPGVGEARPDPRLSKGGNSSGRAIDTSPYDAEHGGVTTKERTAAGLQSVVNAAAPAAFGPLKAAVGTTAALATEGAAAGAAYNPDDPFAGAISGGISTPLIGTVARGATKVVDKARDLGGKAVRIRNAPALDEAAVADTKATKAADQQNYGRATAEGDANQTSPALEKALDHPRVQPFAEKFRASDRGQGADAATVARETYKLMSKQRRGLQKKLDVNGYDADMDLEIDNLKGAMRQLKDATSATSTKPAITMDIAPETFDIAPRVTPGREPQAGPIRRGLLRETTDPANPTLSQGLRNFAGNTENAMQGPKGPAFQLGAQAEKVTPGVEITTPRMRVETAPAEHVPPVMPSFPGAVAEHARRMGERQAFNTAADATRRVMGNKSISAKDLESQSPAAFREAIKGMSPAEAEKALAAALGRAKEGVSVKAPTRVDSFFGSLVNNSVGPAVRLNRIAPFIDQLDQQAGNLPFQPTDLETLLKYLAVANAAGSQHSSP